MQNKLKVAWICHFTSEEIQSLIPIWKQKNEFASWIPNMLKGFEIRDDIELHVISPHEYLKNSISFALRRIQYHFIPYGIPIIHRHWPAILRFDVFTNFKSFNKKVTKVINSINPDIINLIGAENAYYSSSILNLKKYPILISIQGFITQLADENQPSLISRKRFEVEKQILASFNFYSGEQDSSTYLLKYNPNHVFFKIYSPINEKLVTNDIVTEKIYDCIYFGLLSKIKGVEDFIKVIAQIKKNIPSVKACIVGGGDKRNFQSLAKKLNCDKNIIFIGFVRTQKELFEYVKSSKVFLAPPHKERLSMTIREAMYLKVPVVAYATGGIPYINESDENIYLVETGDYREMARRTILLLNDNQLRNQLAEKAFSYSVNEFSLKVNTDRLVNAYLEIINYYKLDKNEL